MSDTMATNGKTKTTRKKKYEVDRDLTHLLRLQKDEILVRHPENRPVTNSGIMVGDQVQHADGTSLVSRPYKVMAAGDNNMEIEVGDYVYFKPSFYRDTERVKESKAMYDGIIVFSLHVSIDILGVCKDPKPWIQEDKLIEDLNEKHKGSNIIKPIK